MKNYFTQFMKTFILVLAGIFLSNLSFAQYGTNLVLNSGFEDGTAINWTKKSIDGSQATLTDSEPANALAGNIAAKFEVTTLPASQALGKLQILSDVITIAESKSYRFSVNAKTLTGGNELKISILTATDGGATKYGSSDVFTLTTDYKEYAVIYTPQEGYTSITIRIQVDGTMLDTYFFDEVKMQSVDGFANNGFEEGINFSWSYDAREGAVADFSETSDAFIGNKALKIDVTTAGEIYDYVTVVNDTKVPTIPGNPYKLTFYAKSNTADVDIKAGVTYNNEAGYLTAFYDFVNLTTDYQKYEILFKPVTDGVLSKVKLWTAEHVSILYFDEFSLSSALSAPLKITSRPNTTITANQTFNYGIMVNQEATLELSTNVTADWLSIVDGVLTGTPTVAGTVEITITAKANGETDAVQVFTLTVEDDMSTQIDNNELELVSIYPNPANGSFQIKNIEQSALVKVFNTTGKLIFNKEVNPNEIINLEEAKGLHLIKIQTENSEIIKKIIMQ